MSHDGAALTVIDFLANVCVERQTYGRVIYYETALWTSPAPQECSGSVRTSRFLTLCVCVRENMCVRENEFILSKIKECLMPEGLNLCVYFEDRKSVV